MNFNILDFGYMGGFAQSPIPAPANIGSMIQQPIIQVKLSNSLLIISYMK